MENKTKLTRQINRSVIITTVFIMTLTSSLMLYLIHKQNVNQLESDMLTSKKLLIQSLQVEKKVNEAKEKTLDNEMYTKALEIGNSLKGKKLAQITNEDLKILAQKFDVTGITLVAPKEDSFYFYRSTEPKDIGQSMKGWGYWETAIKELWNNQPVTTTEGWKKGNFWAGPAAMAGYDAKTLYKFTFYFDNSNDFIIAPWMKDSDSTPINRDNSSQELSKLIMDSNPRIANIGIFYTGVLYTKYENITIHLNGSYTIIDDGDHEYINQMINSNKEVSIPIQYKDRSAIKHFIPLSNDEMLVLIQYQDSSNYKYYAVVILDFLLGLISFPLIINWVTRKKLHPISQMNTHLNRIAAGDLSTLIDVKEKNELGELSQHMNETTLKMRDLVAQVNRKAVENVKREFEQTGQVVETEFERLMTSIRSQRHDFKNHIQVVYGLLDVGLHEEAKSYMRDYTHAIQDVDAILKVQNPALLVFFNTKYMIATTDCIDFTLKIDYGKYDGIPIGDWITILSNLLDNAFEATMILPPDQRQVTVELQESDREYRLSVTNKGPIIPVEEQSKIFDSGYSTKRNSTEDWQNRGSGLSIVKQTVEHHGGSISLDSTPSQTTFSLVLPFQT